jgi:hypothetical protein
MGEVCNGPLLCKKAVFRLSFSADFYSDSRAVGNRANPSAIGTIEQMNDSPP